MLFLILGLGDITLTSSVQEDGRVTACAGEIVSFTCAISDATNLEWKIDGMDDSIRFLANDPPEEFSYESFVVALDYVERNPNDQAFASFVSTLKFNTTAVKMSPLQVTCGNSSLEKNETLTLSSKLLSFKFLLHVNTQLLTLRFPLLLYLSRHEILTFPLSFVL